MASAISMALAAAAESFRGESVHHSHAWVSSTITRRRRSRSHHIFYSDEDGGYIADIPDLEACSGFGRTRQEALAEVERAKEAWLAAPRDAGRPILDLPYAITIATPDSARPGQRHTSLDETLFLIPGVTVFNRNNPAQDARISIRGFGARSSFGVRGIRVMRDGIPFTLPDGQTPIDYLDLENVGRVEVLRGSASIP